MKIRFLVHDLYTAASGGVLTTTVNLAQQLAARHDVELVSVLRSHDEPARRLPAELRVRTLHDTRQPRRGLGRLSTMSTRVVSRADPRHAGHGPLSDIALLRYLRSARDGAVVGMQPGINVAVARYGHRGAVRVVQDHRPFTTRPAQLRRQYVSLAPRLDAFLTLTERDARAVRRAVKGACLVDAIPNGAAPYDGPVSDQQHRVVVAAGWLKRNKGHDRLVEAWAKVRAAHPDWRLLIYGEGPERRRLEAQIRELGLVGSVRLAGYSTRLQSDMAGASIFAMGSRREGFPMVLLEAMSCALPVVSFDCPTGPREIIRDGVDGLLVPDDDVDAMASALQRLIAMGPDRRLQMGGAARESALASSAAAERWETLLTGLDKHKRA